MNTTLQLGVTGIGAFLPGAPDWTRLRAALCDGQPPDARAPATPAAILLPAAERRRAPAGVRLAAEVAQQACAMANCNPAELPCVFSSTHGEVGITDYVCTTLATAPTELSPTKFHNSVLNAPAGYWTIATGCTAASSAVSAWHRTLGAGLLEAAALACSEATPVLFAHGDVAASGPLVEIMHTHILCGMALVLIPHPTGRQLQLALEPAATDPLPPAAPPALRAAAADNPATAQALALLGILAAPQPGRLRLPLSDGLALVAEVAA